MGIRDGTIEAVSADSLRGERVIDAGGLVVAPGFIDLHEHGQVEESYALMVGQLVNYGVSVGHIPARMAVLNDQGGFLPSGAAASDAASPAQIDEMARLLEEGLQEGAVAVGFGMAYTPAATLDEFERMLTVAVRHGASAHIHVRGGLTGLREALGAAERTGASLHVVHANSSGGPETTAFLGLIEQARDRGQDVTTEAYPYGAGMTAIEAALFDDWESWPDERYSTFQWVETGERLDPESFARYRAQGGEVIIHSRTEEMTRAAIGSPLTMIASDGFILNGRGHPRTSGTYSKVLGKYVRDEGLLDLGDALRRMTIEPARRLEARVPGMRKKGRVQVGADADLTLFDPATVIDRSTYLDATIPAEGIEFVVVGGVIVVDRSGLVEGVRPGAPIRAPKTEQ